MFSLHVPLPGTDEHNRMMAALEDADIDGRTQRTLVIRLTRQGIAKMADAGLLPCPQAYRPDTLQTAVSALTTAQGRHDPAATFAARGDLQRLLGRGHTWDGCIGCLALDPDHTEAT